MTKQEVIKLLVLIETVYSFCVTKDETVSNWFEFCSELEYETVMKKIRNHIRKNPYPPAFRELAESIDDKNDSSKKWFMVSGEKTVRIYNNSKQSAWMDEYSPRNSARE
jgi:hypothetical protein